MQKELSAQMWLHRGDDRPPGERFYPATGR